LNTRVAVIIIILSSIATAILTSSIQETPATKTETLTATHREVETRTLTTIIGSTITRTETLTTTATIQETGGITPSTSRRLRNIYNNKLLQLEGDQILVLDNANYTHENNIVLKGNSKLLIRDSRFEHKQTYGFQYGLEAMDSSQVIIENSELHTSCKGPLNWSFHGNSSMVAVRVHMPGCNTWNLFTDNSRLIMKGWDNFGGTLCENASADIRDSANMEIELCFPSGAIVDTALPLKVSSLMSPNEDTLNVHFSLKMTNSSLAGWGISVLPQSRITIRDSPAVTVSIIIGLPWRDQTVVLEDLRPSYYQDSVWQIVDSRLQFINSTAYGWEPSVFAHNNTLILRNSVTACCLHNSDHAKYVIENSTMGMIRAQEFVEIVVTNSTVLGDVIAQDNSRIRIMNSTVGGNIVARNSAQIILVESRFAGEIIKEDDGRVTFQ
jgi:hypothetical protein